MGFLFPVVVFIFFFGLFVLLRLGLRLLQQFIRSRQGGQGRDRRPPAEERGRAAENPEARVFRIAERRGGRITVSDLVLDLGLSVRQAEELLNSLEDGRRVLAETAPNGLVVYEFPEFTARRRKA